MHASPGLLIIAAILGVVVPIGFGVLTASLDLPIALAVRAIALAAVPVLIARVAFRQGYDAGVSRAQ
jgi:hypothetical protein